MGGGIIGGRVGAGHFEMAGRAVNVEGFNDGGDVVDDTRQLIVNLVVLLPVKVLRVELVVELWGGRRATGPGSANSGNVPCSAHVDDGIDAAVMGLGKMQWTLCVPLAA